MISGKLVSVAEAAQLMGCTPGNVRILLRSGRLEGEKISKRIWMVRVASLRQFLEPTGIGRPRVGKEQ